MSRSGNSQDDVKRVRSSRVEITHTVHLPNGTTTQESLPLVIGVIADLSGDWEGDRKPLRDKDRDFVHVTAESFDKVLAGTQVHLNLSVPDTIRGEGQIQRRIGFKSIDDFHPDKLVDQIPELQEQLRKRRLLDNLRNLIGSDPALQDRLEGIVGDPEKRAQFLAEAASRQAARRENS